MKKYLNNKYLNILVAGLALSAGLYSVSSAEEAQKAMEGEITVGGTAMIEDLDDASIVPEAQRDRSSASSFSAGQAPGAKGGAEYMDIADEDVSPFTKADLNYRAEGVSLDFFGRFETTDDQEYALKGAINRVFLFETDYSEFTHRLDHDYLENLNAHIFIANTADGGTSNGDPRSLPFVSTDSGFADNGPFNAALPDAAPGAPYTNANGIMGAAGVYNTDWNEAARYYANRSEWNNSMKFNIPSLPGLKIGFDHRLEKREGCKQAMTMSKCSGCHIESYSKNIDETTNDYVPKVSFQVGALSMEYSYLHREFDDDSQDMLNGYNTLAEAHVAGFSPLLQFSGNTDASLPFNNTPDSTKDSNNLRMRYDIDEHNVITGGVVYSKIANTSTDGGVAGLFSSQNQGLYGDDLELESTALMAKWNSRLSHTLNLTVHGKYQTLSNDDVFIDVNDGVEGVSGVLNKYNNQPYTTLDFNRLSGYDMDIFSTGVDAVWKAMHGVTISGGYEFHQEDRDNYLSHHVPETTDEHTFKLKGDWRVNSKVKLGLGYKLELIDDPYALYHAVCPPDGSFPDANNPRTYAGPATDGNNYYRTYEENIYGMREGTRTNQPESVNELSFKGSFMPMPTLTANFYSKYRYAENSDLGGNDWEQDLFNLGLNVVMTPTQKFTVTAGYDYFYDTIDAMYCIAVYDG